MARNISYITTKRATRKHIKKLVSCGIFDYAVLLGNGSDVGTVKEIRKIGGLIC